MAFVSKIEINNEIYEVNNIINTLSDYNWDNREVIQIEMNISVEKAKELFKGNMTWYRIDPSYSDPQGEEIPRKTDLSDYCIIGDIIDHRDGTITIKMGKQTEFERLLKLAFGGNK